MVFIAADGGRAGPGFAINICTADVGVVARTTTRGAGAQVRKAGQFRIRRNVADAIGWLRRRATVLQRIRWIRIRVLLRSVEIDDTIVERTAICATGGGV